MQKKNKKKHVSVNFLLFFFPPRVGFAANLLAFKHFYSFMSASNPHTFLESISVCLRASYGIQSPTSKPFPLSLSVSLSRSQSPSTRYVAPGLCNSSFVQDRLPHLVEIPTSEVTRLCYPLVIDLSKGWLLLLGSDGFCLTSPFYVLRFSLSVIPSISLPLSLFF